MKFKIDVFSLIVNLVLILVNLVPLFGLLYFDWGLFLVIACYLVELLVAEIIVIIKIVFLSFCFPKKRVALIVNGLILSQAFSGIFFMTFIPFMAIFSVFPGNDGWSSFAFLSQSSKELVFFAIILMIRYLISFFMLFVGKKEYLVFESLEVTDPKFGKLLIGSLMTRLTSLVFIIGISLFVVAFFRLPIYVGAFFIIAKIFIELYSHNQEHFGEDYENKQRHPVVVLSSIMAIILSIISAISVIALVLVILVPIFLGLVGTGNSVKLDVVSTEYGVPVDVSINQSIKISSKDNTMNLFLVVTNISVDELSKECKANFYLKNRSNNSGWLLSDAYYVTANLGLDSTIDYFSDDQIFLNKLDCDKGLINITLNR
jgi:MFS family permease